MPAPLRQVLGALPLQHAGAPACLLPGCEGACASLGRCRDTGVHPSWQSLLHIPAPSLPPVQPASAQATATLQALSSYGAPEPPLQAACFQQWQALVACVPQGGDVEHALKLVGLRVPWMRQSKGGYWLCLGWGRVRGRAWAGAE